MANGNPNPWAGLGMQANQASMPISSPDQTLIEHPVQDPPEGWGSEEQIPAPTVSEEQMPIQQPAEQQQQTFEIPEGWGSEEPTTPPEQQQTFNIPEGWGADDPSGIPMYEKTIPVSPVLEAQEAQEPQDLAWGEVIGKSIKNSPRSVGQVIAETIAPFFTPIQTAKAIGGLAKSLAQKIIPGRQQDEEIVDKVVQGLKDDYGTVENFKRKLAQHPAGVVADLASVLMLGGGTAAFGSAKVLGQTSGLAQKAGKVAKIGETIEPFTAVGRGIKKITPTDIVRKVIPEKLPAKLYQKAVKFSAAIPRQKREKLINTALENKIRPTLNDLDNLNKSIKTIDSTVVSELERLTKERKRISGSKLFKNFDELIQKNKFSGERRKYETGIRLMKNDIYTSAVKEGKVNINPIGLQKFKNDVHSETSKIYHKTKKKSEILEISKLYQNILGDIDNLLKEGGELGKVNIPKKINEIILSAQKGKKSKTQIKYLGKIRNHLLNTIDTHGDIKFNPKDVQQIKQNLYAQTASSFEKFGHKPIQTAIKQNVARAAKESLEEILPELKNLNAKEGSLIALRDELEKSVDKLTRKDVMGIGMSLKGIAGGVAGGPLGLTLGLMISLFDMPQVKARLATVASKLKKEGITIPKDSLLNKILQSKTVKEVKKKKAEIAITARQVQRLKEANKDEEIK